MLMILNDEQIKEFGRVTGVKANKVFISKVTKYYYATLLDVEREIKLRISKELADKFI